MKAYEYYAEVLSDGHLSVPEGLKGELTPDSRVRVMLLFEEEDSAWNNFAALQFFKGYAEEDAIYDNL